MAIRNWRSTVRCNHVDVEVHQPLARDVRAGGAHSVPGVAGRTSEAIVDVPAVLGEARVRNDDTQIVALAAQPVRAIHAEIGVGEEVGNLLAGRGRLRELIAAFQDVGELRTVWSVWSGAAKFTVVVTVMAIAAEDLSAHGAPLADAIKIHHILAQAGLRKWAAAGMGDGVARGRVLTELRDDIQGIGGGNRPDRQVPKNGTADLPGAGAMAAQAILILIDRGINNRHSVGRADASYIGLRDANQRRRGKACDPLVSMPAVAVRAGGVPVLIQ